MLRYIYAYTQIQYKFFYKRKHKGLDLFGLATRLKSKHTIGTDEIGSCIPITTSPTQPIQTNDAADTKRTEKASRDRFIRSRLSSGVSRSIRGRLLFPAVRQSGRACAGSTLKREGHAGETITSPQKVRPPWVLVLGRLGMALSVPVPARAG